MESQGTALVEARAAYDRHEWARARDGFRGVEGDHELTADDLERFAWSCRWAGDAPDFLDALERAEVVYVQEGDLCGAARMALEQARHHIQMLNEVVGVTAYMRALDHLADQPESPEHAQALWALSFTQMMSGELDAARAGLDEAMEIGRRLGDDATQALALQGLAHLAATAGSPAEAMAMADQAAALAMRPTVAPIHAGHVYCAVITIFRGICDWRRATEWTQVSTRYCERESITGYTGLCRFHQAELDRLHGRLERAEEEVQRACEELLQVNRFSAAWGFTELVDIRVRRGDLDGAEEALARAVELGSDGQPGRARLLLARGSPGAAVKSLERALADPGILAREARVFVLPVYVTASLAVDDVDAARSSAAELTSIAERLGTDGPGAAAAVARGEIALHVGDASTAIDELSAGIRRWCEIDAPYETAQARVLLARALRTDGDDSAAQLELRAAKRTLEELGAHLDLQLGTGQSSRPTSRATRTFMFSDIVESTRLAEAIGDGAWRHLLGWHDRTLRGCFMRHEGEEIKHGGDGFFVAFADPDAAIGCATEIQRALAKHRDEHGFAPEVRIGLHIGEADRRDGDYFGSAVTRASRIGAAAVGGEILVSTDVLDASAQSRAMREPRSLPLKGIQEPVSVCSVAWD